MPCAPFLVTRRFGCTKIARHVWEGHSVQHDSERQLRHMPGREQREGELSRSSSEGSGVPEKERSQKEV
jgi:hypothetical protein